MEEKDPSYGWPLKSEEQKFEQTMSDSIGKIAGAMAKAQGMMRGAVKDSTNPFFKSNYADLASVIESCREALSQSEIAVFQTFEPSDKGIVLVTLLAHSSGEWIRGKLRVIPNKNDAQAIGSAATYARRYSLSAMVGTAQVDDDGESAMNRGDIQGVSVDMAEVNRVATKIIKMIQDEDPETLPLKKAVEIYKPLSNDFRMALQPILKEHKVGKKTAWSVFREYLKMASEQ